MPAPRMQPMPSKMSCTGPSVRVSPAVLASRFSESNGLRANIRVKARCISEFSRECPDHLTAGPVGTARGPRATRDVFPAEYVRAIDGNTPPRRIVMQHRVKQGRGLPKVHHRIERTGQGARAAAGITAAEAAPEAAQRTGLLRVDDEQRQFVLPRGRQRRADFRSGRTLEPVVFVIRVGAIDRPAIIEARDHLDLAALRLHLAALRAK